LIDSYFDSSKIGDSGGSFGFIPLANKFIVVYADISGFYFLELF
jgi:hypothetical protein